MNRASDEDLDKLGELLGVFRTAFPLVAGDNFVRKLPEEALLERDRRGFYRFKPEVRRKFIVVFYKKS